MQKRVTKYDELECQKFISPQITIVIAAFNEEEGIVPTICELKKCLNQPNLVVVDGNSSDRTLQFAKDLGAEGY